MIIHTIKSSSDVIYIATRKDAKDGNHISIFVSIVNLNDFLYEYGDAAGQFTVMSLDIQTGRVIK